MSFLYPAFLIGAAAIALPIVLHLLRRDVAPEVPFTAVRLLRQSPIERSKRRRLRDLLLLAARVAALLLLAGSFARPYFVDATAGAPLRIVALDRSFSMGGAARFAHAIDVARSAIADAGAARVAVIAFDDRADVIARPGSPFEASAAIGAVQPGFGATRYASAIARAVEIADGAPARLVVITDLQRNGWEDEPPVPVPHGLQVEVRDVGQIPQNLSLTGVRVKADAIVASIRNAGSSAKRSRAHAAVDGREMAADSFAVAAGSSVDVSLPYRAPRAGSLVVTIDDPDGLAADNVRYAPLDPAPRPRVLILTAGDAGASSGFYVERALEASAGDGDAFEPVVMSGTAAGGMSLDEVSRHSAILLLSTRGLDRTSRDTLGAYVRRGGGLMIVASSDVDAAVLSAVLDWRPPLDSIEEGGRVIALAPTDPRHPIFRPFGALAANLGQVRFERAWRVRPAGWDVVARFTDGTPALLERRHGEGHVVLFASDVDRRWNQFPLHPAFVPFVVESIRYVASEQRRKREFTVADAPAGLGQKPGIYRPGSDGASVAVNVDPRESALARLTPDEFAGMIDHVASTGGAGSDIRAQQMEAGQSYWRYGLALMLMALVGESFVGRFRVQGSAFKVQGSGFKRRGSAD